MSTTTATQRNAGLAPPAPGRWVFDTAHSSVEAVARHLMVSKVRGRFTAFEGAIEVAEDLSRSSVDVTIDAASIDTRDEQRDGHLRSPDFLDIDQYPTLRYSGTGVRHLGGDQYEVDGELTIRGITQRVPLRVTYLGVHKDPWGNAKAAFSATAELDREAFGMTWNAALETGGVLVGKKLQIEIEIQAARAEG